LSYYIIFLIIKIILFYIQEVFLDDFTTTIAAKQPGTGKTPKKSKFIRYMGCWHCIYFLYRTTWFPISDGAWIRSCWTIGLCDYYRRYLSANFRISGSTSGRYHFFI